MYTRFYSGICILLGRKKNNEREKKTATKIPGAVTTPFNGWRERSSCSADWEKNYIRFFRGLRGEEITFPL